mmetsp:Transcript_26729/g.50545  ORF Transcript_26729/g.50545 Transcript_26729/m.50545 type:complete len:406 (-) Transcript_26729:242-1459(-)
MANEPQSWSEAIKQYEQEKRGGTRLQPIETIPRYGRTKQCPLGATRRNDYSHPISTHPDGPGDNERYRRHGYGGAHPSPYVVNTITQRWQDPNKEAAQQARDARDDCEGRMKVPGCAAGVGSNRPMPLGRDNPNGRADLFDHLSYQPGGHEHDSWVGNTLISTTKGKQCDFPPPVASKGRKDLFDIVGHTGERKLGDHSGDAWIGNQLINPLEGKQSNLPPFLQKGRQDLFDTIQMSGLLREGDSGQDKWIGHAKINPIEGKKPGLKDKMESLNDMPTIIRHQSPEKYDPSEPVGVLGLTAGRARGLKQWPKEHKDINQFKKTMDNVPPQEGEYLYELDPRSRGRDHKPVILDKKGRRDLFGVLQQDPNAHVDEFQTSKAMVYPVPGSQQRHKGRDMLHWHEANN